MARAERFRLHEHIAHTILSLLLLASLPAAAHARQSVAADGRALYQTACAACHGSNGTGPDAARVKLEAEPPDFTDCSFASREPLPDWVAVAHQGGPARGFSEEMPAFGDALTEEELARVISYVQTFCTDRAWPRGELNLPRAFFTEKAFPEDEAVSTLTVAAEGPGAVMNEIVYEKRFGARHQIELKVPFGVRESTDALAGSDWNAGVGDIGLGFKSAVFHSATSIVSLGAEVALPTGSESKGFGSGTVVFEPFAAFGHAMGDSFIHLLANVEFGADSERAESEVGARAVIGRTFAQNRFGRTWSPMLEVLASSELEDAGNITWDLVPQMQVSLSTRQHVLASFGVRVPATDASLRSTQLLFYLLWDWYDGPFFDGW